MRLKDRLKAIEQRTTPAENGVVIVKHYETVQDAIKRTGLSEARLRLGIIIPEKNPR